MRTLACIAVLFLVSACGPRAEVIRGEGGPKAKPAPVLHTPKSVTPTVSPPQTFVIELSGLGLFEDERAEAEELVAAWARAEGLQVVPVSRAQEVFARARRGQSVETGEACGTPLARYAARERFGAELGADGWLEAAIGCERDAGPCRLTVLGRDALDWKGEKVFERRAPFARDVPWREALPLSLAALEPVPEKKGRGGGGVGIGGFAGGGVVEAKPERLSWSVRPGPATEEIDNGVLKDGLFFPQGDAPLRACFDDDQADGALVLEVDERGQVARCESREAFDTPTRCACEAFEEHARARPELHSRRLHLGFSFSPADLVTPENGLVKASLHMQMERDGTHGGVPRWRPQVSDPSIEGWQLPGDTAIARCFLDVKEPSRRGGVITVRFDAQGSAAAVDVKPTEDGLSDIQRACVARVFEAQAKAPCPAVDDAQATAALRVSVRRLGDERNAPLGPKDAPEK